LSRMHARPAFQRSIEKGGAYRFGIMAQTPPGSESDPEPAQIQTF
jgi:hypothetical protein